MPPRAIAGFAAALGAIVLAVALYFVVLVDRDKKAARVAETSETVFALQRLEDALARAESAQRGYLLTREQRYLQHFERAAGEIGPALDRVRARAAPDPGQRRRSDALEGLVEAKLADMRRAIVVREEEGLATALRLLGSGEDMAVTEWTEAVRAEMEAVGRAALGGQRRAWFGSVALTDAVFIAANVVLLAFVAAAGFVVRSEMRERAKRDGERARMLELQERILGIVSHDLRNPLSAIQTGAVLLSRAELAPPQRARIAERIQSSSKRMERIIRDLLDYTRARAGHGIPLSIRPADVGEVCARVVDEVALSRRDGVVDLRCERDLSGEWDPDRLEQAMGNLVSNALQYASPGTPVRVRAVGENDHVRVEVENEGPPIPPHVVRSMFDPFQRGVRDASEPGSLGLGLYIVRSIVEAHGGSVGAESGPSRPVTFTLRLPRTSSRSHGETMPSRVWRPTLDGAQPPRAGTGS